MMENRKKAVVVGDGACGKSSLISMLNKTHLPGDDTPNVYEEHFFDITLCIHDTTGEKFE